MNFRNLSVVLGVLLCSQAANAYVRGGRPLAINQVINLGEKLERGYRALTAPTLGLGRLTYADCTQTGVARLHCVFNYDKGANYSYVSRLTTDVSYLDGIPGESVYRLQVDSLTKPEDRD